MWRLPGRFSWTTAWKQVGGAASGTAHSFLHCCHLNQTRQAHQVSVLALAKLQDVFLSIDEEHTVEVEARGMETRHNQVEPNIPVLGDSTSFGALLH